MSAPVEMTMAIDRQGVMEMEQMGFVYPSRMVGSPGNDDENVVVRDVPAYRALSYTWQGPRNKAAIAKAHAAIDVTLKAEKLAASSYRVLSYNSPYVSRSRQTHELQAILK